MLYNYTFWGYNERRRIDGPPRGRPEGGNSSRNIDEEMRQYIDERIDDEFADRDDDVSYAEESPRYALVRNSSNLCCRGEDRLNVSCNIKIDKRDRECTEPSLAPLSFHCCSFWFTENILSFVRIELGPSARKVLVLPLHHGLSVC